jgi:hypothetical protein
MPVDLAQKRSLVHLVGSDLGCIVLMSGRDVFDRGCLPLLKIDGVGHVV